MYELDEHQPVASAGRDSSVVLFVSIYLLLLAFFIILNSISNQEQARSQALIESVGSAFRGPHRLRSDFVDLIANPDAVVPNDEFREKVKGIFSSLIEIKGFAATEGGDGFRVDMSADRLFFPGTSRIKDIKGRLFGDLVALLQRKPPGFYRELEFVLTTGAVLPEGRNLGYNLAVRRAGAFARTLIDHGADMKAVTIGLRPGPANEARLTFINRRVGNRVFITTPDQMARR